MALWDPGQRTIFFDVMLMTYEGMESRLRRNILELIRKLYIKEVYDHWMLHIFVLLSPSCGLTFFCVGMEGVIHLRFGFFLSALILSS